MSNRRVLDRVPEGRRNRSALGYHGPTGRWVSERERPLSPSFARISHLDGTLVVGAQLMPVGGAATDAPRALAVLRPGSVRDIVEMLRFARRHAIPVVGDRARRARSRGPRAGIVFDMSTFAESGPVLGDLTQRILARAG